MESRGSGRNDLSSLTSGTKRGGPEVSVSDRAARGGAFGDRVGGGCGRSSASSAIRGSLGGRGGGGTRGRRGTWRRAVGGNGAPCGSAPCGEKRWRSEWPRYEIVVAFPRASNRSKDGNVLLRV